MALQETESAIHAIESGDTAKYDEELSEQQAIEYAAKLKEKEEGADRTILIIESNPKVQDSLREKLKALGYRVLITGDTMRGLSRFDDLDPAEDLPADCVIFGCVGLGREGIRAFETFVEGEHSSKIPAIILVPENLEKQIKPKWLKDHRLHLTMPLKMKRLRRALRELLKNNERADAPSKKPEVGPIVVQDDAFDTDVEFEGNGT